MVQLEKQRYSHFLFLILHFFSRHFFYKIQLYINIRYQIINILKYIINNLKNSFMFFFVCLFLIHFNFIYILFFRLSFNFLFIFLFYSFLFLNSIMSFYFKSRSFRLFVKNSYTNFSFSLRLSLSFMFCQTCVCVCCSFVLFFFGKILRYHIHLKQHRE